MSNPSTYQTLSPISRPPIWTPITAVTTPITATPPSTTTGKPPGFPQRSAAGRAGLHLQPDAEPEHQNRFTAASKRYYLYAGSSDTQVLKWLIDHTTYGVNSELRGLWGDT